MKVVITGGTKGIGLETVKLFVANKHEVVVLARDFADFPLRDNPQVKQKEFDLREIDKIPELASEIGDIDILIKVSIP